jgi:hypothetical protein
MEEDLKDHLNDQPFSVDDYGPQLMQFLFILPTSTFLVEMIQWFTRTIISASVHSFLNSGFLSGWTFRADIANLKRLFTGKAKGRSFVFFICADTSPNIY